jgi:hypothetical protein
MDDKLREEIILLVREEIEKSKPKPIKNDSIVDAVATAVSEAVRLTIGDTSANSIQ